MPHSAHALAWRSRSRTVVAMLDGIVDVAREALSSPWGYLALLSGDGLLAAVLTMRNVLLLAVLVLACVGLRRAVRGDPATR